MRSSPAVRGIVLLALLGGLFGLCGWYGSLEPAPAVGAYPGAAEIGTDANRYVGERVAVGGEVVAVSPPVIDTEYGVGRTVTLRLVGLDDSIQFEEGDSLRVYGVLQTGRTVRVLRAFAVPWYGRWYTWSVSFLAGLWVLARIVRSWRLDRQAWVLRRRQRECEADARDGTRPGGGG